MNNYTNDVNYVGNSTAQVVSPIYEQIESLDKRLETTYQEFMTLLQCLSPVLTQQNQEKEQGAQIREAGKSPLHDRLLLLNEKASAFARAVSEVHRRVTV